MIKEAYVSFEVAKLLKEKGFDEKCQKVYLDNGKLMWFTNFMEGESFGDNADINTAINYDNSITSAYLCPTHQVALAWLREVHGLSVETFSIKGTSNTCPVLWKSNVIKLLTQDRVFSGELIGSYEEAIETALKYSLENLI